VVVASFFISTLILGLFASFGVFFKPMLTDLVLTRAEISGAVSLSWIMQGLASIAAGRVNDRLGPRIVMTACGIILGLGCLLMSQISTLWQLYLFYGVLIGIGMSGSFVPLTSTVTRWFVKRRSMMTGIVLAGNGVGILLGPLLAAWLISRYEWRLSYIIIGVIALVAVILLAQLLRRDPAQVGQMPYGENKREEKGLEFATKAFPIKEAISTRQFWLLSGMSLCLGFSLQAILVHIVPHATDLEISAINAANILATIGGASVIGRFLLGSAGDRIGNRQVFIIGFALMAASLLWLVSATEVWALFLFAAVFGFAIGGCTTSPPNIVAKIFGLSSHGLILGFTSLGFCLGGAAGPFVAGYIFDFANSYQTAFLVCAAISAIGLILTVLLKQTKSR
jgi:OFA family oxalate/formate antiporter-like MFS transporter